MVNIWRSFLCLRLDISRVKKWVNPVTCVSSRKLISSCWISLTKMTIMIIMAVVVMMIMMLRFMVVIMVVATAIITKSKMIKMVMMMVIVTTMIRHWMHELLYIFRFKYFTTFFQNLEFGEKPIRFTNNNEARFWSEWEKLVINIGEWLWYLSKYCPICWSCLQFVLIGRCWKFSWSIMMEYSLFSDIARNKSWVSWIFVFWIQIRKEEI